ncbi:AmmeMemoRadiSam system protein A [Hwanghaeella sp. LZ110]|uniref:AmmeMemoRadiSam system protein A n=1 Tax=Hwanghaeella sp. LZ110 TaxID=3402810 RepID=UPI003B66EC46
MTAEEIAKKHRALLMKIVHHALEKGAVPSINLPSFPEELKAPGATFVTLEKQGRLRGCIGSLQAHQPLVQDLAQNAYRAGFKDPRFPPITAEELPDITSSISILSPPSQMLFQDEQDLLAQLVPDVDGLILQDGNRRATFLPQVWEQLPDPKQFLGHLKRKAGLAEDHWSPTLTAHRYHVVKVA